MPSRPALLIFDVNETLLDLAPLKGAVDRLMGKTGASADWFQKLLHHSLVETISGRFSSFGQLGHDILQAMATQHGVEHGPDEVETALGFMRKLQPHADVVAGLSALAIADIPMVALTNGSPDVATEQLSYAGLKPFFKRVFSVVEVGKFKPHPATYLYVTDAMQVHPSESTLVAAHDWDILGAQRAGLRGCYIDRGGLGWIASREKPNLVCHDLREAAKTLSTEV